MGYEFNQFNGCIQILIVLYSKTENVNTPTAGKNTIYIHASF